jgi:oligopeptide/dipeptide ABC transporter ATP-binding protein
MSNVTTSTTEPPLRSEVDDTSARPETLLDVRDLRVGFATETEFLTAIDNVSFTVGKGETVALVGESGSGKSVTALSIMRLLGPGGRTTGGEALYGNRDLLKLSEKEMRRIRGNEIAMIFQEPMTSLNPVFRIGDQLAEAVRVHRKLSRKAAREHAGEMLKLVSIPDPIKRLDDYPHNLSGGMRQRVMIAMALSCDPDLLIADEPTTALDVTIQAQIMELLADLQERLGLAILLITHDLGVVAEFCRRVIVMYTGRVVEEAPVAELYRNPKHPYTQGLLASLPKLPEDAEGRRPRLSTISGMVPGIDNLPPGCKFNPRCPEVMEICRGDEPARMMVGEDHDARCYLYGTRKESERS